MKRAGVWNLGSQGLMTLLENTYFPSVYVFPECLNENTRADPESFIGHSGQEVNTRQKVLSRVFPTTLGISRLKTGSQCEVKYNPECIYFTLGRERAVGSVPHLFSPVALPANPTLSPIPAPPPRPPLPSPSPLAPPPHPPPSTSPIQRLCRLPLLHHC